MELLHRAVDKVIEDRLASFKDHNEYHQFCKEYVISLQNSIEGFKEDDAAYISNLKEELKIVVDNLGYFYFHETDRHKQDLFYHSYRFLNQIKDKINDIIV